MVSGPVTSRQKEDKKVEAVTDLIILGSKITVDGDYSHEIKTLAPWKKNYNKPRKHNNKKKSRDITLPTKVHTVKVIDFPVVMYGCESWTTERAEHQRTDTFILWCWRILLRVPWNARRSNQLILKEISPEYSSEGLMLKVKLLMWRANLLEKTMLLGKTEGK